MSLTGDLAQAVRRAEAKKQVARLLAELPPEDRRGVLLDLLAGDEPAGVIERTRVSTVPRETQRSRRGRPVRRAKANGAAPDAGRTDTLLAALKASPRLPVVQLAAKVYPELDDKTARGRTRSLLSALKDQGRVKNPETGHWEAT
jgi:hypothetical protein